MRRRSVAVCPRSSSPQLLLSSLPCVSTLCAAGASRFSPHRAQQGRRLNPARQCAASQDRKERAEGTPREPGPPGQASESEKRKRGGGGRGRTQGGKCVPHCARSDKVQGGREDEVCARASGGEGERVGAGAQRSRGENVRENARKNRGKCGKKGKKRAATRNGREKVESSREEISRRDDAE